MLTAFKRLFEKPSEPAGPEERVAAQPPGEVFPWPRLTTLTALEEVIIGVPPEILGSTETIGSVIKSSPDLELRIPTKPGETLILLRLKAGMSASLTKSCQAVVVADDKRPRRIKVGVPGK